MELRTVDPRTLAENPDNPRRKAAPDQADQQMAATARAIGILQPPVVRETEAGLMTIDGHRRVRAAIAAELAEIRVLVLGEAENVADDEMRSIVGNIARKAMSPVEQWRGIEKLINDRWTEEAICTALVLPMRTLRKLRLLAHLHPPMLDRMHAGDMPGESDLRTIASASPEEQAAAWKKHKPKKNEAVSWWQLSHALTRRRMRAADAAFDAEFAAAYGVQYSEDLFAPAGEDSRTTTNVDGFLAAQHAWVEANLPENGVVLQTNEYGGPKLPREAQRFYGKPGNGGGESVGHYVDERTGRVETVLFTLPAPAATSRGKGASGGTAADDPALPAKPRPDVTQKGQAMIGDMRTDALHAALRDEQIDDGRLIALLVLALAGSNVEVKTGLAKDRLQRGTRAAIAGTLTEGGALTSDPAAVQQAARAMLAYTLSCRENWSQSGAVARIAGDAIDADAHLPNMATAEFLSCLSKAAVEGVAIGLNVPVQPTGKATRGAVIARVGQGRWAYPQATFSGSAEAVAAEIASERRDTGWMAGTADDEADTLLDEEGRRDGLDDGEVAPGTGPAEDAEAGLEDGPQPNAEPAPPPRRRRSRKDAGEDRAAA